CEAATMGKPGTLFGDGSQTRDFVYVGDVAKAFELAGTAKGAAGEVINVGSGRETSIADLVRVFGEIRGKELEIVRKPAREGEVTRSRADPSKARSILKFQAKVSLQQGLAETLRTWTEGVGAAGRR